MEGYKSRDKSFDNIEELIKHIEHWDESPHLKTYAAFFKDTSEICGYALVAEQDMAVHLSSLKTVPKFEKYSVNAALIDKILLEYNSLIGKDFYISDGSRNVLHETKFQDYLEKYFGFRKVYCRLHIYYRGIIRIIVKILFPFKNIFNKFDDFSLIHKINGILNMESYKERYLFEEDDINISDIS